MSIKDFTWKIGGEAGYGIMSSGLIFAKTALRSGYFVFDINEYPSLIRGGHNTYTVRVSDKEIQSQVFTVDFLVALNQNALDFHQKELSKSAGVIINTDKIKLENINLPDNKNIFPIPLIKLAKEVGGQEIMMNNVALGATAFLLKADFEILASVIGDVFFQSKKEVIDLNIRAAKSGFDFAQKNFDTVSLDFSLKKIKNPPKVLLSGNDAICLGAIKAGCKFFAAYPMTPINSMINFFAAKAKDLNMVYFQPEDEIAGINSAIGAALAGLRSMVATSGGGFSLMVEAYGLAGMTETPIVIVEGQRPGPSTGLPTWGSQGDLRFVLHASQDDFPRAFNLAEIYQTPVIILVDKHLCESHKSLDFFDDSKVKIERGFLLSQKAQEKEYKRYQITSSGISPRSIAGRKGITFVANSDEHNELGFSEEDAKTREAMVEKRMRKLITCQREIPNPKIYGDKKAKILLVGWGSSKGPILEAQKILLREKIKTQFLHLNFLNPLPLNFLNKFFLSAKENKTLIIEQNSTAQLAGLIREKTGFQTKKYLLKYNGRPFFPEEIVKKVKGMI